MCSPERGEEGKIPEITISGVLKGQIDRQPSPNDPILLTGTQSELQRDRKTHMVGRGKGYWLQMWKWRGGKQCRGASTRSEAQALMDACVQRQTWGWRVQMSAH